ncbi:hypothetical protein LINPERHAP1_LOCUS13923 [Linum perenne]
MPAGAWSQGSSSDPCLRKSLWCEIHDTGNRKKTLIRFRVSFFASERLHRGVGLCNTVHS